MSWLDQLNQAVRAYCVIVLVTTFCLVFAWGVTVAQKPIISTDAFAGVLGFAMTYWFKTRDEEKQAERAAARAGPPPGR